MVDIFPFLNYMPLWMAKWKRDALEWHERETKMFEDFYNDVGKQMVNFASGFLSPAHSYVIRLKEPLEARLFRPRLKTMIRTTYP